MEDNKVESNCSPKASGSSHQQEEDENERDSGFSNMHEDDSFQDEDDSDKDDEDDSDIDDEDDEENGVEDETPVVDRKSDNVETERHPKKRRLKNLISKYEFAPRLPASSPAAPSVSKQSLGSRNSLTDWTEHETLVLLDAWGNQQGRKSLRSEDQEEVAEKVSEVSKTERTDARCRNRLDTMKKKYKKEKTKFKETCVTSSTWDCFKKMDMLMSSPPQQGQDGLSCGLDAGEYVFTNSTNGLDEMRDSPRNSNSAGEEDSDELPPSKRAKNTRNSEQRSPSPYKLLADSILNFSKIYEKVESSRRQHMNEVEKMRMSFYEELEIQKKESMERARIEIAKIQQLSDEDNGE